MPPVGGMCSTGSRSRPDSTIPKVRDGSYFPSLLEPRRRAERALLAVVQEAYVAGVSTRRVDDFVRALGPRRDQQERGVPDLRALENQEVGPDLLMAS